MIRRKTKIRVRILAVFSTMLFLSFSLIGIIFNIAVRQYIQSSAISQLDATYDNIVQVMERAEIFVIRPPDASLFLPPPGGFFDERFNYPTRRNSFRISSNAFIVDDAYNLSPIQEVSDEALEMTEIIKETNIPIAGLRNLLARTGSGIYYVSAFRMPDSAAGENAYLIVYADVTGLLFFSMTINTFLVVLVCVMFTFTVFVTFFLSNTITLPIKKLGVLASKIGQGDFTPNDFRFNDEEFASLNIALNNSAKQLSIYDSEQKEFFQNVSHELRTPLMSIQCQAEGIAFGLMEPKKASETILQETGRLSELVTDLLYISKIDNITTVYTSTKADLLEIIRSCAQRQQIVAEKRNIRFSFDFDEPVVEYECVAELISRAVDNLVSNAIRYASSEINISCHKSPHQITICVTDDGGGIEPEGIPHVFERFYKGSGGNYGIGLSIVKSIVEQHNGSISAENTERGGALFTITLPGTARR